MKTNPNDFVKLLTKNDYECGTELIGLTKREYFAAMAMQGWISFNGGHADRAAEAAIDYADKLITELNKES